MSSLKNNSWIFNRRIFLAGGAAVTGAVIAGVISPAQSRITANGEQKTNIKKYGTIGLFFFVMLPFFMTGPVIGSIIGYLLNYKAIHNFLIVFSGTLSSIVIYALIGNTVIEHINQYVQIDLVKKWVSIIVGILIVLFLIYHIKTVKAYLDSETDGEEL